jgi:hypothetical protein
MESIMLRHASLISVLAVPLIACAARSGDTQPTAGGKADSAGLSERYYAIDRDKRLCASPACGGYFVRELNADSTTCADGTAASACYVARVDPVASDAAIARGTLWSSGKFGALATTELWRLAGGAVADVGETFVRMTEDGSTIHVEQLGALGASDVADVAGDDATVVDAARADLDAGDAIIVAGGNADGPIVRIDALYERFAP